MIIRPATVDDAFDLAALRAEIVADPFVTFTTITPTVEDIRREITTADSTNVPYLVAEIDNQLAGYATWQSFRNGPGYRFSVEHSVHVLNSHRGRGVGYGLMCALLQKAKEAGLRTVIAGISGSNPGALAFHEKLGFVTVARMPNVGFKADRWLELVLMQYDLATDMPPSAS